MDYADLIAHDVANLRLMVQFANDRLDALCERIEALAVEATCDDESEVSALAG